MSRRASQLIADLEATLRYYDNQVHEDLELEEVHEAAERMIDALAKLALKRRSRRDSVSAKKQTETQIAERETAQTHPMSIWLDLETRRRA